MDESEVVVGEDAISRCWWCGTDPEYRRYHDEEWGFPSSSDRDVYEKICLEGFQCGLSWITILRKRPAFRAAFADFDIETVARFGAPDVERLLGDAGIVRHRKKIESAINNARRAIELLEEYPSLAAYVWHFEPPFDERPETLNRDTLATLAKTPASTRLARDMKKRGWTFFGPTTAYAFMQSEGIVNDHMDRCDARERATKARVDFLRSNR